MADEPSRNGRLANIGVATVDALKGSPGLLVVALLSLGLIGALFWSVREVTARRDKQLESLIDRCLPDKHKE
jgi:hypothetical protein